MVRTSIKYDINMSIKYYIGYYGKVGLFSIKYTRVTIWTEMIETENKSSDDVVKECYNSIERFKRILV